MDKPQFYLGLLTTLLGILLLVVIIPGQHIPPMMSTVSPDFYPNIGAAIFTVGGIGLLVSAWWGTQTSVNFEKLISTARFCLLMSGTFALTLILFQVSNFIIGGIVLVSIFMWILGERRKHYLVAVSLLSPLCIWLFIDVLLGRNLP